MLGRIVLIFLAILLAPVLMANASAQKVSQRTVLVVHWGSEEFPVTPVVNETLRQVLLSDPDLPVDYFSEYLESDVFPSEQASRGLADYIRGKYRGRRIDLVIAIADPALQFVVDHRAELFPDAPIVYSGLAIPERIRSQVDGNVTGVLRDVTYAETLKVALELHPSTERVFVVAKGRNKATTESARAAVSGFSQRVSMTYVSAETVPELLATVKAIPPRSLVLYIWHSQEDPGRLRYTDEVARLVAQASPVPVYGTNDQYLDSGVVGGVLRDRRETAARLGNMARRILRGTPAQNIPVENARLVPIFDWRQLQRWAIDPERLPPGSRILFRTPTAWESYREYIVGTVVVVAMQLLLIAGLLAQRARRHRAEHTIGVREATLRTSYERIRQLTGRLINAQEAARADIARELHDDVCQELVGVSMVVSDLQRSSGSIQDTNAQQVLSDLQQRTIGMVEGLRRLSHDLHPATLRLVGLAAALSAHCLEVEKHYDVQIAFRAEGDLKHIHPGVALCLFRIAQEALRNGVVHSKARRFAVSLVRIDDGIELTVADDGVGFDLDAVRRDGRGLGLVSMEERAHAIGGDVHIVTRPQEGTTVCVGIADAVQGATARKDDLFVTVRPVISDAVEDPQEPELL